jgi:hypothetical protein
MSTKVIMSYLFNCPSCNWAIPIATAYSVGYAIVKTHTRLVNGARLEYVHVWEHVWEHVWNPSSHLGHPREPSNPAYRVTYLYVLPYLSLYVLSYLRKHDYKYRVCELTVCCV